MSAAFDKTGPAQPSSTKIYKSGLKDLKLNQDNPRTITDAKFAQLVKSVKDFPQMLDVRPIVISEALVVLGGNMRVRACIEAGMTEVPVIMVKGLTDDQQREFIIKDNVGFGEWNWEQIVSDWPEAPDWGLDVPDMYFKKDVTEDDYEIPDEIQTDIVLGDLFEIGEHRLLCGDSTKAEDVGKLLAGKEPYLMVTDPPYGVKYDPKWRLDEGVNKIHQKRAEGKVMNDDRADWTESWALSPAKVVYVWHGGLHSGTVSNSLEQCDYQIRSQIIWAKPSLVMGRGHYHWRHEPCWYAVKKGSVGNWAGDRKQSTVWDIQNMHATQGNVDDGKNIHSTQKPVECMARPIRNHDGDVYDPFLGSGTTMVAAHQLNRKCYGIEIDPKYCQVIIDRMRKLDPNITITKNGVPLPHAE